MKKEIQVSNEREPTEEMILAGIEAANRTMPYVSDAQCVAAIWKAMQAANSQAMPQGVEEWIDSEQVQLADESPAGWGRYIPTSKARSYLSGMAIVPVDAIKLLEIAKCPICGGGGAYYDDYGYICQCQWCDEKSNLLAATKEKEEIK